MSPGSLKTRKLLQRFFATWLIVSSALIAGCELAPSAASKSAAKPELGLMTSLPIYWEESEELGDLLNGDAEPNWVRAALEKHHRLRPLDNLSEAELASLDYLLLAQPRTLSPQENVALDTWVRAGGTLLLFADPLLTQESRFALGDARAPQPVALLSPILARWGLEMTFDEDQPEGERLADGFGYGLPVNLAGRFGSIEGSPQGQCVTAPGDVAAYCRIGSGRVWLVADAAALDASEPGDDERRVAVKSFLERSFAP